MKSITLEQGLFFRRGTDEPALVGRSAAFRDPWIEVTEQMIRDFGTRPVGVRCPLAVFARPLGRRHVALVRVADQDAAGAPPAYLTGPPRATAGLGFHVLVLSRAAYQASFGDPFLLAERVPVTWAALPTLPTLTLPAEPAPARTVAQVQKVLQRVKASALREDEDPEAAATVITVENSESPALLGGVQILVDGGRLIFARPHGDLDLLTSLWTLLPSGTRGRLWPASFAFCNRLGFDAVVLPHYDPAEHPGSTSEEQAADYPAGSYELDLQIAAEAGDQAELERVFRRRDSGQVLRHAVAIVVLLLLMIVGFNWFDAANETALLRQKAAAAAGIVAAGDPWTAFTLLGYGNELWRRPEGAR